jgi:hypothetical protein
MTSTARISSCAGFSERHVIVTAELGRIERKARYYPTAAGMRHLIMTTFTASFTTRHETKA